MANFLKFCAVVWTIGICAGLFGAGLFGSGAVACYLGKGGLVDRFSQGFSSQVAQNPQGLAVGQGSTYNDPSWLAKRHGKRRFSTQLNDGPAI
jgi:hypothetical protein